MCYNIYRKYERDEYVKKSKKVIEYFAKLKTSSIKQLMLKTLQNYYNADNIVTDENTNYIIAKGNIPVALVAHMDTVFSFPAYEFFHDKAANVLWSPQGLGADDHAGLVAILSILTEHYLPHIILTDKEEIGGTGALQLIQDYPSIPFDNLKFIIELDRQGEKDCVFYNCKNKDFEKYIEAFGFETAQGTFTDISIICPVWGIAGVNLSIGYFHEHSLGEYLNLNYYKNTVNRVKNILDNVLNTNCPRYKYIPAKTTFCNSEHYQTSSAAYDVSSLFVCSSCGKQYDYWDIVEILDEDSTKNVCYNCFAKMRDIKLCPQCNNWYKERKSKNICKNCEVENNHGKTVVRL